MLISATGNFIVIKSILETMPLLCMAALVANDGLDRYIAPSHIRLRLLHETWESPRGSRDRTRDLLDRAI